MYDIDYYGFGLKGMIIIANTYCHNRGRESIQESSKITIPDKTIIGSIILVVIIAFSVIYWYAISIGIYLDPLL